MEQKIFTSKYASQLKEDVQNCIELDRYRKTVFDYDVTQEMVVAGIERRGSLLEEMCNAENIMDAAILLYEAYDKLTPFQASYAPFWEYLTHVDLFKYVQKRWPNAFVKDDEYAKRYILRHWFVTEGLVRHTVAGLWWTIYMSLDENAEDKYHYARFLFDNNEDLRVSLGSSTLFRSREFTIGLLQFLIDNEEIRNNSYIPRMRFILHYFNRLGVIRQIVALNREDIYEELQRIKPEIMKVLTLKDLP